MKRRRHSDVRVWIALAAIALAVVSRGAPTERSAERRYTALWERQAKRDAGQLVERGVVRPSERAPGEQDIQRRLWAPGARELREQVRIIVRDARQAERREQIRERTNETIERRRRQIEQRKERLEQLKRKEKRRRGGSTDATERRRTSDPVSVAEDRRIATQATGSPPPPAASPAAILDRADRDLTREAIRADLPGLADASGDIRSIIKPKTPTIATPTPDQRPPSSDKPTQRDLGRQ